MGFPTIPQKDGNLLERTKTIEERRSRWVWDPKYLRPLVLLHVRGADDPNILQAMFGTVADLIPEEADPGAEYVAKRVASLGPLAVNTLQTYLLTRRPYFQSIDQFSELFEAVPVPRVMARWREDAVFAYQRIAGANPLSLRRIDEAPQEMYLDEAQLAAAGVLPKGRTLKEEIKAGNVFITDYSILEGIPPTSSQQGNRYTMPVIGLFRTGDQLANSTGLAPVAIQIGLNPHPGFVFTPADGKAWMVAKMALQSADVNFHEMGPHLLWAHFMLEPFAVALQRQLAANHPVAVLLHPHFRILIWNNFEGRQLLVSPGGLVSQLLGGGLEGSLEIVRRSYTGRGRQPGFNMSMWDLPTDVANRGLDKLESYPYRDDGMLIWDAIKNYVGKYLDLYYGSDQEVANDREIQEWAVDVAAQDRAHVAGMPATIPNKETLQRVLTRIIFGCGPFHSALNFTQYEMMAYAPNMPASLYTPIPDNLRAMTPVELDRFILKLLPPPAKAKVQLETVIELTSYRFDQFGNFEPGDFSDPRAQRLVEELQAELQIASKVIERRNDDHAARPLAYDYLQPNNILNSASI